MDKKYLAAAALLISIIPGISTASVIGHHTTDKGKTVELSGLEWLELTATNGLSVKDIKTGKGGFTTAGWRYATRSETEKLMDSLWGGKKEGYKKSNFDGAEWFFDNFGIGQEYDNSGYNKKGATYWSFAFGAENECGSATQACYGAIGIKDKDFKAKKNLGMLSDKYGLSSGKSPNNRQAYKPDIYADEGNWGHLLVRQATSVAEPAALGILSLGLLGFVGMRKRKQVK